MKKILFALSMFVGFGSFAGDDERGTEWSNYFMPGLGYKVYVPRNTDLGMYQGVVTEFIFYARAKGSNPKYSWERKGPSRVKTYGNLSILKSDAEGAKDIYFSNLGATFSFEGNANRKYLLPYFGLEFGGLHQRDFATFHFTPVTGIQLLSNHSVIWTVHGGFKYTTKKFDEYSGYTLGTTLNVMLWN
jgi:hypothetical protein